MAGIDNITNEILQEARDRAAGITSEAEKKAEALIADAKEQGEKLASKGSEKSAADAKDYAGRVVSQAALRKRQTLLRARQEIIGGVLDKAYEKLHTLPDKEYFSMILKLAERKARSGEGEMLFSKKDLARLPKDFEEQVEEAAEAKGGSILISDETADIEDGFILRYGGIEENCTLKALFAEKRDELSDKAAAVLWK